METKAGFTEIDITPPIGTHKIGWLRDIVPDSISDPLFARIAVIESGGNRVAFIQLDTLSVRWTQVAELRRIISGKHGFLGQNIMVAATHNHAGPAVANCGMVKRDEKYIESLLGKIVSGFGSALENLQKAELGCGSCVEFGIAHNRRVVMRDGTVKTHGNFDDPDALYIEEGPVDPEVTVLAARRPNGRLLGMIVNFTCHPTDHGGDSTFSAGYPGVLAAEMKLRGSPVTLFLNGASGNIHNADPCKSGDCLSKEKIGLKLADDVSKIILKVQFQAGAKVCSRSKTIHLPYRNITEEEVQGKVRGAQRFIDPAIYDCTMPDLLKRIRARGTQPAEVQVLFIGDYAFVGIPAEYFVQHGLRIKEQSYPRRALIVGHANGMVGYLPHRAAFLRGGYETTLTGSSRMAPEAGDMLADCAVELVRQGWCG